MNAAPRGADTQMTGNGKYRLDEQIGFLLRIAMQRHTAIFASKITKGLTQTQFAALARLREVGPCSQNQLGRLIFLDAATTKGVVDRLKRGNFVTVCPDPVDRRRRAIALTDKGLATAEAAIGAAREITQRTLHPLTRGERDTVIRLLRKLT